MVGSLAGLAMIIVGCTSVTEGSPTVNATDAPVYKASVSASIEESAASSSSKESERQKSLTTEAVHSRVRGAELQQRGLDHRGQRLRQGVQRECRRRAGEGGTGRRLAQPQRRRWSPRSISDPLSQELKDALNAWVDAARGVATAIAGNYGPDEFNAAVTKLNDVKTTGPGPVRRRISMNLVRRASPNAPGHATIGRIARARQKEDRRWSRRQDAPNYAQRLGIQKDQVVQELGWDDDVDDDIRADIEEACGGELLDEDADEVIDVVLLWWRDDDGDLVDRLMDAITPLADDGVIWVLTPKTGKPGHVMPAEIAESAPTAGLMQTSSANLGDWSASRLVQPKSGRGAAMSCWP